MGEAMTTTVELVSQDDSITFYPTPDVNGWVYDNATLDRWYAPPSADIDAVKRPNQHGAYGLGQTFLPEHEPIIVGQYYGADPADALAQRERLNAFYNDGRSIIMRVNDELGETSRTVWMVEPSTDFRYDFSHFPFDLSLVAPDPRRYGATEVDGDGMPAGSSGLVWDLGTAGSGLYLDWGTPGTLGQVTFTNAGNATTFPRIDVAGAFDAGFRITEIETGRELTFERATGAADVVSFDSRTQRATLDSGDVTGFLTSREWFEIPKGATCRYQITPLGGYTGSPTITLYAASAKL
jgi:hypothetical protein